MKTTELLDRVPRRILPERGSTALCAVSGGLDSMCLLHLLEAWCARQECRVVAAHFNHRLRGLDADRDEAFVRDWCAERNIPFVSGSGDVRAMAAEQGLSLEEAARNARYAFLRREAARLGAACIYTAHHADDNAETMLLHLIRGTGLTGLTGMPLYQNGVARPLLNVTRAELADYAAAQGIPHVEDATNADPEAAARNFLRLRVMPLLQELNPQAVEHMSGTAHRLMVIDQALEQEALRRTAHVEVQAGRVTLSVDELLKAPDSVQPRMLLRLFDLLEVGRRDIGAVHLNGLLEMARHTTQDQESRMSLPHGVTARHCRRWLILETRPQPLAETQLLPGTPLIWGGYTLTLLDQRQGEGLALRPGTETVTVAPCVPGDRLTLPSTRGGSRTIKRLCLDRGLGLAEREVLPAIFVDGHLAAVWRLGVDTAFVPEDAACRFIQITPYTEERDHHEE